MATDKLDIKTVLKAIDTRDISWFNSLSDEEKKKLTIWQLMRFVSSCDSKNKSINHHYLTMTNDLVNVHFNTLKNHPELQFRLLQVCGIGTSQYHAWIAPGKRSKDNKIAEWVSQALYPQFNDDEIDLFLSKNTKDDLKQIAIEMGLQDKEITELFGK